MFDVFLATVMTRVHVDRLVNTFIRIATVDSPSREESTLALALSDELARLGWRVDVDGTAPDGGGNVVASLPGNEALEPLLFTSHMDVVMPCRGVQPRVKDGVLTSAGDTVLGADAKASVAAVLEMAHILADAAGSVRHPPLEVVFTWGEEIGHLGAKALDTGRLHARRAYVLDGLSPVGTIVVAAPTYHAFSIRVVGKAAHAGVEPERGISAIVVAAQALTRLPWGRLDESTTANVGTIQGGSVRNAVAAEAHLHGEVRSLVPERAATAVNAVRNTFEAVARDAGASADVDSQELYTGYVLADDDAVVALARGAFAAIDAGGTSTSTSIRSGGGSDANELNARGVRACVLGIGAQDCHSVRERISVQQLELLTVWMLAILERATIA